MSPSAFDPLTSVPVRLTYGTSTVWRVGDHSFESVGELASAMRAGVSVSHVDVETNLDLLQLGGQVDLVDTPGVGSEERFDEISAAALRSLDAVVLVVRYPALFTQYTRVLMDGLEADIGKLFLVWNLDADCAELTPEERERHAETLRKNVASAHELYLVDARAGLRAQQAGDREATEASGLIAFTEALARFASSEKRELTALREAAKRAHEWIDEAKVALTARQDWLRSTLAAARGRLDAVQRKADEREAAEQSSFETYRGSVAQIGEERSAAATKAVAALQKGLQTARRQWIRNGDLAALESAISKATGGYAGEIEARCSAAVAAIAKQALKFGATTSLSPWQRQQPSASPLAPDERRQRANSGSLRVLRRALWRRWYLPGLTALAEEGVQADLTDQSSWFDAVARDAQNAARTVLDGRLEDIRGRVATETGRIKTETDFEPNQAEFEALSRHLPIVESRRDGVTEINREARSLID